MDAITSANYRMFVVLHKEMELLHKNQTW